jgi:4-amino-4-deoxy-L-arabinose transferase-like glycosyltransferase
MPARAIIRAEVAARLGLSFAGDQLQRGLRQASALLTARNLLLVIVALALWLRLVYVTEMPGQTIPTLEPAAVKGDARSYDSIATNLLDGRWFVNSAGEVPVLPPVYPTFLAAVYEVTAHSFAAVRIAQAFIGAATCAVVYLIGRKAFNPATGLLAAALAATYPWFIYWNRFILTETLFVFLLSLSVLAMLWAAEKPVLRNLALAGFLLALTNLTHTSAPLLPFLFAGWLLVLLGLRRGAPAAGLLLVFFVLTIAPWTASNFVRFGELIPVSAHGGTALYVANNTHAMPEEPHQARLPDVNPADIEEVEGKPFLEKDSTLRAKAIRYITHNPGKFLSNAEDRIDLLWESVEARRVFNTPLLRSEYYNLKIDYTILVMLFVGTVVSLLRWRTAVILLLVPLQFTILHAFFPVVLDARSRVGAMPVAMIVGSFAVYVTWMAIVGIPRWASAVRQGWRERSLHTTWRAMRADRRT